MGDSKKRMRCLSYRATGTSVSSTTAGDPHLEALIEEVKKYPCLYNINSLQYRDQYRKEECWNEISRILHSSCGDLKKEWKRLRDGFRQALVTRKKEIKKKVLKPWKYEEQMDFLKPYICPKSRLLVNARSAFSDNEYEYFPMIKQEIISDDDSSQQSTSEQPSIVSEHFIRNTIRNMKPDPDGPPPPPTVEGKKRKKKVKVTCKPRKRVASACASRPDKNSSSKPSVGNVGIGETLPVANDHGDNGNMPSISDSGNNGLDGTNPQPCSKINDAGPSNNNHGDCGNPSSAVDWDMIDVMTSEELAINDSSDENPNNNRVVPSTSNNGNTLSAGDNVRTPSKSNGGKNISNSTTSNADNDGSSSRGTSDDSSGSTSSSSDGEDNDTTPITSNTVNNGSIPSTSNASNNVVTASHITASNDDATPSTSKADKGTPSNTNTGNKANTLSLSDALNNSSTQVTSSACSCTPSSNKDGKNVSTPLPKSIVNNGVTTSSNSAGIQCMSSRFARNFGNYAIGQSASNNQSNDGAYIVFVKHDQNNPGNNEPNNETSRCYRIEEFRSGQLPTNRGGNNGGNHFASMRVSVPVTLRTRDQVYQAIQPANGNSLFRNRDQQLSALQLFLASVYQTIKQMPLKYQNKVKSYILEYLKIADQEFEEMKANLSASARNNLPRQGQPVNNRGNNTENRGTLQSAIRFLGDNDARHAHLQLFLASIHESVRQMPGYLKSFMKINMMETVTKVEASYRTSRWWN